MPISLFPGSFSNKNLSSIGYGAIDNIESQRLYGSAFHPTGGGNKMKTNPETAECKEGQARKQVPCIAVTKGTQFCMREFIMMMTRSHTSF